MEIISYIKPSLGMDLKDHLNDEMYDIYGGGETLLTLKILLPISTMVQYKLTETLFYLTILLEEHGLGIIQDSLLICGLNPFHMVVIPC